MEKKKKKEKDVKGLDEEVKTPVENTEEKSDEKPSKNKTSVKVEWRGGVREYSKEVHGDNFMDLAKSFAEKFNGEIK